MQDTKIRKLVDLLERLNSGEKPEVVKGEAQAFLATIDAAELSSAEQQLIEAGLPPEDLRHLCSAHMEMLGDQQAAIKAQLPEGHVLDTLYKEHVMILEFLDGLDKVNQVIQKKRSFSEAEGDIARLRHLAEHLVGAEKHHEREEDVLFPAVSDRGLYGPPQIMIMEHNELRPRKKQLLSLAKRAGELDWQQFKRELDSTAKYIVFTLRDHIFKEDNILYPTAMEMIQDDAAWAGMKQRCDAIGYCCFSPKV